MVKLDVGASFRLESCSGATGAVVRDAKGFFLAASSHLLPQVRDVLTAEAFALLHGLQLADHLGCSRVLVNSDNSSLMEAMQGNTRFYGSAAAVIEECHKLADEFQNISFESCPREENEVADELASKANQDQNIWIDCPPSRLVPVLLKDVTIFAG